MINTPNPVQKLMIDLHAGRVSTQQAIDQLPGILKPARVPATGGLGSDRTVDEMHTRMFNKDEPDEIYTPGSWDDVEDAYMVEDILTDEQYNAFRDGVTPPPVQTV